jgi:hypothetical protein
MMEAAVSVAASDASSRAWFNHSDRGIGNQHGLWSAGHATAGVSSKRVPPRSRHQSSLISGNTGNSRTFSHDDRCRRHGMARNHARSRRTLMTRKLGCLCGVLACLALPCGALAQNPQPAPPAEPHPTVAPPSAAQPPPEQIAPGGGMPGTPGTGNLSQRLSRQEGTLQPPTVDPGIRAPLPPNSGGTMPVIPPPGTPGGNRTVVPK